MAHFADEFGNMPVMRVSKIGYGMGKKDFDTANCIRVMLGETESEAQQVLELKCNIDDMTAEGIGYATEQLLKLGAVDVFTVPIGMKKNFAFMYLQNFGQGNNSKCNIQIHFYNRY